MTEHGTALLAIHSYDDLLALHLIMMEAKFHPNSTNVALQGSHRVSDLALNIVSALNAAVCMDLGPADAPDWITWQQFSDQHREYPLVMAKLKSNRFWAHETVRQQQQYVRDLISPYVAQDILIQTMLKEAS